MPVSVTLTETRHDVKTILCGFIFRRTGICITISHKDKPNRWVQLVR